jgi:TPR repeat protein
MEANDARAICVLGCCYHQGVEELQHEDERAIELWKQAAKLGFSQAHYWLGEVYHLEGIDLKKAEFHYEAAAMAGHKVSRFNVGRVVSRVILETWNELLTIGQLQQKRCNGLNFDSLQ